MAMKKFSATLPEEAVERLDRFCEDTGLKKWRAIVVAFELIRHIPPGLRDRLMKGDPIEGAEWLESVFATWELAQAAQRVDGERPSKRQRGA